MKRELTKEQVQRATRWWANVDDTPKDNIAWWNGLASILQLPWQDPTYEEVKVYQASINLGGPLGALQNFIQARNAALLSEPKPEDPRVNVVATTAREYYGSGLSRGNAVEMAKSILVALDREAKR